MKNAEMWFAKLDPKYPNARINKDNPTWELQLRTDDAEQKKEWEALGFKPKLIVGKEGEDNEGEPVLNKKGKKQWRVNLKRKSLKLDKSTKEMVPNEPVKVVNGHLEDIAANTIGNGSIGNIRIFQYEYDKVDGTKGLASVLMGVQVKKHIVYTPKARDDHFDMEETETIMPDDDDETPSTPPATPATKAPGAPKVTPPIETADGHPEDAF